MESLSLNLEDLLLRDKSNIINSAYTTKCLEIHMLVYKSGVNVNERTLYMEIQVKCVSSIP